MTSVEGPVDGFLSPDDLAVDPEPETRQRGVYAPQRCSCEESLELRQRLGASREEAWVLRTRCAQVGKRLLQARLRLLELTLRRRYEHDNAQVWSSLPEHRERQRARRERIRERLAAVRALREMAR